MTPIEFAAGLIAYCGWSRASVTSYGRSQERNQKVGGVKYSKHCLWLAADVVYDPHPRPRLADARRRATQLGMRVIREDSHDHLQAL
jgi:hypothetical protein